MRFRLTWVLGLLLATCLPAQDDPAARTKAALDALVKDERLFGAQAGVLVVDLADGSQWASHQADKGFMTASNMKLVSSAVALISLGPDHRFVTRLQADSPVEGGVLQGDLFLVGSGDPTLGGRQEEKPLAVFERMGEKVRQAGIREVKGRVVGIDDVLADEIMGRGWQWDYQSEDYAAQLSGLCFGENVAKIVLTGTTVGQLPAFRVVPDVGYILIRSQMRCGEPGTKVSLAADRGRGTNTVQVMGSLPVDSLEASVRVTVENPTRYAARALKVALRTAEIDVKGPAVDSDDIQLEKGGEVRVLAEHSSPPLAEILVTLNKVSQNLYAEQLVRMAATVEPRVKAVDMEVAEEHAKEVLGKLGVDTRGMVIADGSDLSRRNLVQPQQLAALLAVMWYGEHRDLYLSTLPVAGIDGTLKSRFPEGSPAHGRVRAKTGFISRVVALSGYVPRPDEKAPPVVFSVLLNNFTCSTDDAKAIVDAFVEELARAVGWQ